MRLRIGERDFSIIDVPAGAATVKLQEDGASDTLVVSRGELAHLVVTEQAEFIDDPAEPPLYRTRIVTDISHLSPLRMLDWHAKVIVLRMRRFFGQSPKSIAFRNAFEQANQALAEFYAEMGLPLKTWSDWHIYHDLLRWRANRFEWFAFQRKGVEYCPHATKTRDAYAATAATLKELVLANPHLKASGLHATFSKQRGKNAPA
ncbi:MAG: hypothetical protein HZT41_10640 [Dechloromonas sp.]|nr:MAG: hypothetical protein HZT41_10640 [Dechloromonas sp.]